MAGRPACYTLGCSLPGGAHTQPGIPEGAPSQLLVWPLFLMSGEHAVVLNLTLGDVCYHQVLPLAPEGPTAVSKTV